MKRYLLTIICLTCFHLIGFAADSTAVADRDSLSRIEVEVGLIPESLDANVDSLLHSWHVRYFSRKDDFCHDDDENVFFPDSVYIDRLNRLDRKSVV